MKTVQVFTPERKFRVFEKKIKNWAGRALKAMEREKSAVEIYLIGDKQMRFLNKKFCGKNKSTDVLSFKEPKNFPHPEDQLSHLGEIYLNINYIKKETGENNTHYSMLITQLLVHGLLHLLGFRHRKKRDRIKMEKKEKWLISELVN